MVGLRLNSDRKEVDMIGLNRRRMMGGKKLPYDAEIEYLESTGTQYITTSFIPNYDTTIESEVYLPDFASNKHYIYGAGTSYSNKNMEVYTWSDVTMNVNGNRSLSSRGVPTTEFIKLFMSSSRISISNHQNELIAESTFTTNDFTCTSSLILFGILREKIYAGWDKIKQLKVDNRNIPVFDFIPVRIGTTGYMYDRVSKQLFGNAGTGEFILGPDVTLGNS